MSTDVFEFFVGQEVYLRPPQGRDQALLQRSIEKHGKGPFKIERIDNSSSHDGPKLKFHGKISMGLGEDAPCPSMEKEHIWDPRWFTSKRW